MTSRAEVTKQQAQLLKGIRVWLENQSGTTPLELGVFDEIVQRVENHAVNGAIVRVKIKNLGNREGIRRVPRADYRFWSVDEIDQLRTLYREENLSIREVAESLGRTPDGVQFQLTKMQIHRKEELIGRHRADGLARQFKHASMYEAAKRIKERRMAEYREEGAAD